MSNLLERRLQEVIDERWYGLEGVEIPESDPFGSNYGDYPEKLVSLLKDPSLVGWAAEVLLGDRLAPLQMVVLEELWRRPFPMLVATRGGSKSWMLGRYALLRALLTQGSRVVIIGAAFRQARGVFNYALEVWHRSALLRDLVPSGSNQGPRFAPDRWSLRLGDSEIVALPLGTGDTIRGERACVGPETLIHTTRGLVPMLGCRELLTDPEFAVRTPAGWERPSHFLTTVPTSTYEVTAHGGHSFLCSSIHQVMTAEGWKLAKELGEGDYLLFEPSPVHPRVWGEGLSLDVCWVLGFCCGGGSLGQRTCTISTTDGGVGEEFVSRCLDAFGKGAELMSGESPGGVWRLCHAPAVSLLKSFLGEAKPDSRPLPAAVLEAPREGVIQFLQGLFRRTPPAKGVLSVRGKSRGFCQSLQVLLGRLGVFAELCPLGLNIKGAALTRLQALLGQTAKDDPAGGKDVKYLPVRSVRQLPQLMTLYDFTLPVSKCFYGNNFLHHNTHVLADEFAALARQVDVYENVVGGFGVVSSSPVEAARQVIARQVLEEAGLPDPGGWRANQSVIAGTAYYSFNPFYAYWKKRKAIIESRGDLKKLREIFGTDPPQGFDWRDYSVMRLPGSVYPRGFMDEKTVANMQATITRANFLVEYGSCFSADSDGFFKRTLVESCVVGRKESPVLVEGEEVLFSCALKGQSHLSYVFGVDPASEHDNFAVVVLECHPSHRRIVYCWTTTKAKHRERLKRGLTDENDYYGFAARKIMDLARVFPCARLAVDSQGGGYGLAEALRSLKNIRPGYKMILPIVDRDNPKDSDYMQGEHVLEFVQFAKLDYVTQSNHGMKKDFEDKVLLFPMFDALALHHLREEDRLEGRRSSGEFTRVGDDDSGLFDTLEDCALEIEELKDELASIVVTQTPHSRRERYEAAGGKRKDRYSALLMANAAARTLWDVKPPMEGVGGGCARDLARGKVADAPWRAPPWYSDKVKGVYRSYGRLR